MINFENLKTFSTDFPKTWSFLWSPEEANSISQEHKDQIFFLNDEATKFINDYMESSTMLTGPLWKPFNERYFKTIETFELIIYNENEFKKWLYSKPIAFDKFVFMAGGSQSVMLTWKMVIKYWKGIFFSDDLILFDETLNWGLFYFHEDVFFSVQTKFTIKNLNMKKH